MTKNSKMDKRLAWTTPELRRIDAGSAEGGTTNAFGDGVPKGPNKS